MSDPRPIGEELGQSRSELEIRQAIDAAWEELNGVVDDHQLEHVMWLEDRFDQSRAGQLVWLAYLKRARSNPAMIGNDPPVYACRCGDTGWLMGFCGCGRHDCVAYKPCETCNAATWRLWRDGHFAPGHRCPVCSGKRKRVPEESAREVLREERAEDDVAAIEQELF